MLVHRLNFPRIRHWFAAHWPLLLILAALVLFSTKTLFNIPITIMAAIGLYRTVTNPKILASFPVKFLSLLFLCLWLPMLVSLADAVDITRSASTVLPYIRFFFAGIFIIQEMQRNDQAGKLYLGIFAVITFWWADALIQFVAGFDLFGYAYDPAGLAGVFSPKYRLAHMLAVLSPVYFEMVRNNLSGYRWLWLLLLPFFIVILLGNRRVAWMMLLVSCFSYVIYLLYLRRLRLRATVLTITVTLITVLGLITLHPPFRDRVTVSLGLLSDDLESVDVATARRLPIWETGIEIIRAHWFNGVGPRGFRHVYKEYAPEDNFWLQASRSGQTHPHLFIIEIIVETGLVGFAGYLLFFFLLFRQAFINLSQTDRARIPWLIAAVVSVFPLNAHLAFYGSYWSSVTWWIIPLWLSSSINRKPVS
jgi:O-antigen ligase